MGTEKAGSEASRLDALLGPSGSVARAFRQGGGGYEERPQQLEMARAIEDALSSTGHVVVEAGTGVGKSFAYLVPLLRHAAERDVTVAVATSTIALQEQLVRKDLPLLQEALPFEVSFALVKGRGNYLCTRRLHLALAEAEATLDMEVKDQLQAIRSWAATTREGSLQDLPFRPDGSVWERVRAEQGNCKGRQCPHYQPCFYQGSRRRAHAARCLVLNHHVLMADLALRRSGPSFLPKVDAIVVDEAHDLEDTAAQHLGSRSSSFGAGLLLGRLWNPRTSAGLLGRAGLEAVRDRVERVRKAAGSFFEEVLGWAGAGAEGERGGPVRLADGFPVANALSPAFRNLAEDVRSAAQRAGDEDLHLELSARARGLDAAAEDLDGIVAGREGEVRWVEPGARGHVVLASAPVDVGPLLRKVLWDAHPTVVLTSATLATGRPPSFDFTMSRLGLPAAATLRVGSPFDYERQARLVVRGDLPDPVRDPEAYEAALPAAVLDALRRTDGRAFVLFTSYVTLGRVAAEIRGDLEADGLQVLVQGEGLERPQMIERFRRAPSVLFGVSSFWQGVDVPGDALRHVVIARLPFEVPSHPLQRARAERVVGQGGDAFLDLSLPTAAIRLKQGFGRLIRNGTDTGVVTILDPRALTRRYGRYLLESLPDCPTERVEPA
jgi:ATP-dependent DNA helicase DinG